MSGILVLGAGRSSFYLLSYLADVASAKGWRLMVADRDETQLKAHTSGLRLETRALDISDAAALDQLFSEDFDLAVSLLPPAMHVRVAQLCLGHGMHLATASYVSPEMRGLHEAAAAKGLTFLNEAGLDPGIDHLSAMKAIDEIRDRGGVVTGFESYCGGLVHQDDCGDNPWKYKFSWNPRNVVVAGQGGLSVFRKSGSVRCIPWSRVFANPELLDIPGAGRFDAYPNRDSLGYEKLYGLQEASTMLRGTLRRPDFCRAWQVLVELGFTDQQTVLHSSIRSLDRLTAALTGKGSDQAFGEWLKEHRPADADLQPHFDFLGMDEAGDVLPEATEVTAADILQARLMKKWKLEPGDRDQVVMYHRISFRDEGRDKCLHAVMTIDGEDAIKTAMAKTVGLPLAMGAELILDGKAAERGVVVPVSRAWYGPLLDRLAQHGIRFSETVEIL